MIQDLEDDGWKFSFLLPRVLWPLPDRAIKRFLAGGIKHLFVCELNATHQFAEMLQAHYTKELIKHGIEVITISKDDGLPFTPGEIRSRILNALKARNITPSDKKLAEAQA